MDEARFDQWIRGVAERVTRRGLGGLAMGAVAAEGLAADTEARKKKRKKKKGKQEPVCRDLNAECWVGYSDSGFTSMCCSGQCRDGACCVKSGDPCPANCTPNTPCAECCLIDYCAASGVCA